jgi:hypothetical protein
MFGRKTAALVVFSICMLPTAHPALTAESIMQKEMEWAKKGMEKYIDKHERSPVRKGNPWSNDSDDDLYPIPDNMHKTTSSSVSQDSQDEEIADNLHKATSSGVSQDSQDEEIDIMAVPQTSAYVRRGRRNIV